MIHNAHVFALFDYVTYCLATGIRWNLATPSPMKAVAYISGLKVSGGNSIIASGQRLTIRSNHHPHSPSIHHMGANKSSVAAKVDRAKYYSWFWQFKYAVVYYNFFQVSN